MRKRTWLVLAAVVGFAVIAPAIWGDEEKVPLDKLPKAVSEAVKKRFPDAEVKSASKEKEDDKIVYEVAIKNNKQTIDVTITPEGVITGIEKEIAAKDLPKAVAETLEKKYPKATYKVIEEVIKVRKGKETVEYYEVLLVTAEKKKLEAAVAPGGKFLKETDKSKSKD